ncbi:MAG: type II toxin-antitoxin system death-on-curing family toxin, partial [Candidatus Promineifilaceae bacterium]
RWPGALPDIFTKAAALLESLILNHPLVDGNKRTGIAAAGLFLRQSGWRLQTSNQAFEAFALRVTNERPPLEEIAAWQGKTVPRSSSRLASAPAGINLGCPRRLRRPRR